MPTVYQASLTHANVYASILISMNNDFVAGGRKAIKAFKKFEQEKTQIDLAIAWLAQSPPSPQTDRLIITYITNILNFSPLKYRNHETRIEHMNLGIRSAKRSADLQAAATFYGQLGVFYYDSDNYNLAIEAHQQQLAIARSIGNLEQEINALESLGPAKTYIGDFDNAIQYLHKSIEISQKHNIKTNKPTIYGSLGLAYQAKGDLEQAIAYFRAQLEIALKNPDINLQAESLLNLGSALAYKGELYESISTLKRNLQICQKIGGILTSALCYSGIAYSFAKLQKYTRSIHYYTKQLKILQETRNSLRIAICQSNLGEVYALNKNMDAAEHAIQAALSSPERERFQRWNIYILNRYANILREKGLFDEPKALYEEVIAFNTQSGERDYVAQAEIDYAKLLQRHGLAREALQHAQTAAEIYRSCGAVCFVEQIQAWIEQTGLDHPDRPEHPE